MSMIYKKSTKEFWEKNRNAPTYLDGNKQVLPDFIKIDTEYLKLHTLPNCDRMYWTDENNVVVEMNQVDKTEVDEQEVLKAIENKWKLVRSQRNSLLINCDWTQMPDSPLTEEQKSEWLTYRTSLRDLPSTTENPDEIVFPETP